MKTKNYILYLSGWSYVKYKISQLSFERHIGNIYQSNLFCTYIVAIFRKVLEQVTRENIGPQ